MANTHTVKKGDTLWDLAIKYNTTVNELVKLNNIKDPDLIIIGQVLRLNSSAPTTTTKKGSSNAPVIELFGVQSNTDRTMYATWKWDKSNTKHYQLSWEYATGDGVWFIGNDSTTGYKQSIYTPPSNATKVRFRVKAVSNTHTVETKNSAGKVTGSKQESYWTCGWSTYSEYTMGEKLTAPPTPTVEIKNLTLNATIDNLDVNGNKIEFYICKNNTKKFASAIVTIKDNYVTYGCSIEIGYEYKVKCRTVKGDNFSEWSDYSENHGTAPKAPSVIRYVKALSKTEAQITWDASSNAETYEVEYTTEKRYFDSSDQTTTVTIDATVANHAEITGLEMGNIYYFRVRACNEYGKSGWTEIKSIIIGKKPTAPTTWSSATTVIVGEPLNLYWIHNTEDGSSQTYALLETIINGEITTKEIKNSTEEDERDKTSVYTIDTSLYSEGTVVKWRVKTKGITDEYSDWSTQRTIDIYAQPTLTLEVNDVEGNAIESLTNFPFYVQGTAGPNTQKPIGYHVSIVANEDYETIDQLGNVTIVNEGDSVYSKYFNTDEELVIELSAGNVNLENNISYTVYCIVSMNSGLTGEASYEFRVAWSVDEDIYEPNASMIYDSTTYVMQINPYCVDENEKLIKDILLSVYRINYDGSFTEIATDIDNNSTYITDPHPTLNYARYRIVAKNKTNGKVGYYDMPGYFIGEPGIIIQWSEEWRDFSADIVGEEPLVEKPWTGSLLRLPYNIDITDNNQPDVSFIEYIGRENPVSYYGTQLGVSSTWNTDIDSEDEETIYALRRLARWMDNVYVREPSGMGYWANVRVSFNQKHKQVAIPVTLDITKVEGGI